MSTSLRYFVLFVIVSLSAACQPAEFEHCVINDSSDEITVEYSTGRYSEEMRSGFGAKMSFDDFKNSKPWRELEKNEYEFSKEPINFNGSNKNQIAETMVFKVKLAPREVLRLFQSNRLGGVSNAAEFLSITGKLGNIRLEGEQTTNQFRNYTRNWFSWEVNPYVIWYE